MELQIRGISKTYPNGVQALKDVTLTIPAGMYGLLGPNGAGKSTLMRMLATLQEPDSGTVTLGEIDVLQQKERVRETLGYLPQEFGVFPKVSAEDLLDHFALLKGIATRRARREVVEALLRQVNLWDVRTQKLGGYSGGMRQRFGVAVALLGNPKLLIVDEPTAGLDPAERVRFLNLLAELGENSVVLLSTHGFGNYGIGRSLAANGSFFTNAMWFPAVGYQRTRELLSAADRRAHGLEPRPLLESLYDEDEGAVETRGGAIAFEAVIGTDAGQVAVAPGSLRRTWTERGRRYFHYATSAPIGTEWAFFSARYAVHEGQWKDVAIRIFHHPEHTAHLDRILRSVRASLDYHGRSYGAYPYRHLTVVERGGAPGAGMHADASMIYHGEHFPFWIPGNDPRSLDMPYAVVAHEMGHQWTIPYALVEGLPFLAEGLAQFTAMQVVQDSRGEEQAQRLISFMRQPYPYRPIRRGEPLLRAMDPYMARRRGPFAMWALREYAGEERVNGALRRLVETHAKPGAPGATTLDLHRELKAVTPPALQSLLHDLFEVNTFWHFETKRATAKQTAGGTWQVTLDVKARKVVYDQAGVESVVPMDDLVEIGIFAPASKDHDELSAPLYVQKHRIRSGEQTITVTVPRKPVLAGIDPYHLLDWEEEGDDDNLEGVVVEK